MPDEVARLRRAPLAHGQHLQHLGAMQAGQTESCGVPHLVLQVTIDLSDQGGDPVLAICIDIQ